MRHFLHSPTVTSFTSVFRTEVLLNSKRAAPYVLFVLFAGHSLLWWGWSAAATYGWNVNGDYNIVRNLFGFSFVLGLPIFNAVIMGDAVSRDFRIGVDPLLFSKPMGRGSYVFGKFFGNFFVLVCCQSAFVIMMVVLQWVPFSGLVLQPPRVLVFFKHFFFFVVVSHLLLAAIYFAAGTLSRNTKIVYGLAVAFYPLYISWTVLVTNNWPAWRALLDPIMPSASPLPHDKWTDVAFVNQIVVTYTTGMIVNRLFIVVTVLIALAILASRFSITPRVSKVHDFPSLNLSAPLELIQYDREVVSELPPLAIPEVQSTPAVAAPLPQAALMNSGVRATVRKLSAGLSIESRLLRSERTLVVFIPLTALLSFLALPFSGTGQTVSPSYVFASSTANGLLLFLLGVICFYSGEAMFRDRELRVEPLLWSTPASSAVFLLSKMIATLGLALLLVAVCVVVTILTQVLRGQTPVDIGAYISVHGLILIPSLILMTAACTALTVILREKYLTYAVVIALSGGLYYLYTMGHNHWLYNPVLYGLWTPADLQDSAMFTRLVALRAYTLGLAFLFVLIAHLFLARPRSKKQSS